jgi:hypothetical protein
MVEGIIGGMGKGTACPPIGIPIAVSGSCEGSGTVANAALAARIGTVTLGLTVNVWLGLAATIRVIGFASLIRTTVLSPCVRNNKDLETLLVPLSGGYRP